MEVRKGEATRTTVQTARTGALFLALDHSPGRHPTYRARRLPPTTCALRPLVRHSMTTDRHLGPASAWQVHECALQRTCRMCAHQEPPLPAPTMHSPNLTSATSAGHHLRPWHTCRPPTSSWSRRRKSSSNGSARQACHPRTPLPMLRSAALLGCARRGAHCSGRG